MHVIETTDLTKIYQNRYIALNALNLRVEKGMVYGLVGPNGAGKSTTFKVLLGLQRPTAGSVKVLGEEMTEERSDLRRRIGFLPTNPTFPRNLTPIQYLEFVGAILGMPKDRTKIRLATLLQAVDLTGPASQRIDSLSTGMVTRLGIAAALMGDPELLILDEPTSGLDPSGRKQTIELIRNLSGRDRTIIIATHILGDVERVCSDVGIISQGRLIYTGPMSEMRRLARHGTITVEIEGNTTAFEQQIPLLDDIGAVKYERVGSEFRMSFLGAEPLPVYIHRVLDLVDRIGVDLLHFNTGDDEIEEAFLRRLEEDRTRGFLRASAWAASQRLGSPIPTMLASTNGANGTNGSNGAATVIESAATEVLNAGVPRPPAV
jgi:ABC-2 type transport system ATP-binding protein